MVWCIKLVELVDANSLGFDLELNLVSAVLIEEVATRRRLSDDLSAQQAQEFDLLDSRLRVKRPSRGSCQGASGAELLDDTLRR